MKTNPTYEQAELLRAQLILLFSDIPDDIRIYALHQAFRSFGITPVSNEVYNRARDGFVKIHDAVSLRVYKKCESELRDLCSFFKSDDPNG
jgi:hypothetical protein